MTAEIEEFPSNTVQVVPCSNCGRGFAKDRLDTHFKICKSQKKRKPYNISKHRVAGTEAEDLVRQGRLKLEPPKPNAKKSDLTAKLKLAAAEAAKVPEKQPLPPIPSKTDGGVGAANSNAVSYQVVFEGDDGQLKTKKASKFDSLQMRASHRPRPQTRTIDERYLSAERARGRWQAAATTINPGLSGSLTNGVLSSEEEDFLMSSMTSTRTVCSDAFDFLFDSDNLNPDKVLNHAEIERFTEEKFLEYQAQNEGRDEKAMVKHSACCVIS
ncbi:hypothetical protein TCAL_09882 [Tigriopus californicus]|uniref:C2HC/C3H-type domain-containing protein n=1 Tax=Tigriopus californicus TaxID=6832 RepID=A0A553PRR1_TIGCA|nr:uncharacterized protein LOC131892364 isoform X1 [Tigriopus californicus]TRY80374.1 hypothetical protein TCAL_09882 [Tigriopus californicus]